ncbi:DUF4145 domain-containing protein [Desulfosporosinus sp.]|uniref:DUF4145 domain-containing protein n=1 Tax=Desulfosporosinus sp. TaxID=157907 RepID=UPI0025C07FD9|nr:DUF4145 domain-containing protein [Desulfosporosinus sp.]MBC2726108.1 DUF4145 domain-containing protein [Desulfosporosinus sp.]
MVSYCTYCKEHRIFKVIKEHIVGPNDDHPPFEFTFAYCEHCESPSLFIREDFGAGFDWDDYYRIYPQNERNLMFEVPDMVKQSYDDAVSCVNAKIWTAAVVMVGRALEAVCKDAFPDSKNIYHGLKQMKDNGLISEELLEWSNELRVLRNMGAHATTGKITAEDANEALDFLQAILEIFYHLRPKFERMKERRSSETLVS